jgi:hypothetical protein
MPRGSTGRKVGRTSLSDRSEATASSRSDASIPQIHEDLQGLDLGNHPVWHDVPAYGASSRSHRHDLILGEAQRRYANLVVCNSLSFIAKCVPKQFATSKSHWSYHT